MKVFAHPVKAMADARAKTVYIKEHIEMLTLDECEIAALIDSFLV
ncbi:hypothetical protein QM467_01600 [Rhodoblastus sp. 17X3]|nr:hypothetical protein [Rhodoblastus sp. 17X3]MDI9846748.1 hypothetical protein [Rhodoblastus sp. 17X3]